MRWLAAAALSFALAGCGAGPRPDPPHAAAIIMPQGWNAPGGQGPVTAPGWWRAFGDPALDRVVETALANNVDLAIAAARVAEARALERAAHAQRLPAIDAAAAGLRVRSLSPFGVAQAQTAGEPQVTASYDVDLFGRLASGDAAARAAALATEAGRQNVRLAVAATAASGYITLRGLDARLAIAQATLVDREAALRLARRRAEAGYTSQLELSQAEAEYRATEQLVPAAQLAVSRQETALNVLLGQNPGAITRGGPLAAMTLPQAPADLPLELLRRRPDLIQAEQQLVSADRSLDASRAAFLPDLRMSATAGAVASTLLSDPVTIWSVGGSILAPVFEGGRLSAQADASAARRDQAAFAYRKAALTAFRDVEDALAAAERTDAGITALQAQRIALAQTLHLAAGRYAAGYAPYLDQLDAQRGLLVAELSLVQAQMDRLTTAVALFQVMGGGWAG